LLLTIMPFDGLSRTGLRPYGQLALAALLLIAWDASGADAAITRWFGSPLGFAWRHDPWINGVLHNGARMAALAALVALAVACWRPSAWFSPFASLPAVPALHRVTCGVAVVLAWAMVMLLRATSTTSCPWSLQAFGGVAAWVSHWQWGVLDGGPGKCFPSGHATSAFAFWPVVVLLAAHNHPHARRWAWGLVLVGLILGSAQVARGAHHLSHTLWTGWVCAAVSVVAWSAVTAGSKWPQGQADA
jgi:membrane-associated PAP2 superfamily phosphatase